MFSSFLVCTVLDTNYVFFLHLYGPSNNFII